jgi:hypothetical protein
MTATHLTEQMQHETRLRLDTARIQAHILSGAAGGDEQKRLIAHLSAEYRRLQAAGLADEARELRSWVLAAVPQTHEEA